MNGLLPHSPVIKVAGRLLKDELLNNLTSMRIELALGLVGRATLRFADPGYRVCSSNEFKLGATVEIAVPGGGQKLITGTVTGASLDQQQAEHPEFTAVVDDAAYRLTRGTRVTTYLHVTYADVVRTICSQHGLTADISGPGLGLMVHEYLLQAGTDMDYLNSITQRAGYVWWIDGARTLKMAPATTSVGRIGLDLGEAGLAPGVLGLMEFSVKASALSPGATQVTGWDPDQGQAILGRNKQAASATSSRFVDDFTSPTTLAPPSKTSADMISPNPGSPAEAEQIASAMYDQWRAGATVARGTCHVNGAIAPLTEVAVAHAGPTTGNYVVSAVEHSYGHGGFFTKFVAGSRQPTGLADTLGKPAEDRGFTAGGLVIGNVTNITDPDKLGRVKVTYVGIAGEVESAWSRIVTLGAGGRRGITFQPEVGDEVLVGFNRGDTRSPLVLGGLYSKRHVMDDTGVESGKVQHRRMTSRLGHVVELADGMQPSEQHILLQLGTAGRPRLRLGSDRFDIEMPAGKPLTIAVGNAKLAIDASGNITMEGLSISLKATTNVKIEAAQVDIQGTATVKVAGAQLELNASAAAKLAAGGMVAISGAMVAIN